MANDARKISDLNQVNTVATTDRVVVLVNPATTANVLTITVNNFFSNISSITSNNIITNYISSNSFKSGNSTSNVTISAGLITINSISVSNLITGNAATAYANAVANSAAIYQTSSELNANIASYLPNYTGIVNASSMTINSNIGLTIGTSSKNANGYTYLPNGLKMNWGLFVCNTTSNVIFSSAFTNAVLSIHVTPIGNNYLGANAPYVFSSNTTTANIYSISTTTTNTVYYFAVGY